MASNSNLFELEQIEVENTSIDVMLSDGVFDFLQNLTSRLQEDLEELIREGTDKKRFVKALTRIFALVLNTKGDTVDKIKRILRITIETTLKIWQGPK